MWGNKRTKVSRYLQANFAQPVLKGAEKVQKLAKGRRKNMKKRGWETNEQTCMQIYVKAGQSGSWKEALIVLQQV